VVISGRSSLPISDEAQYRKLYREVYKRAVGSEAMRKYHDLGTPQNVLPLNELGGLPTRNLTASRFEGAEGISGEAFAEGLLGRRLACSHCPVACIHLAALREPYRDEPYFYKTSLFSYDYEPIYALGAMLGIGDPQGFLRLMDQVERLGLDAMSTGVVLAWATEALERGLIGGRETLDLNFRWGDYETYLRAIPLIVEQPNDFYRALAQGVQYASSIYGGEDFALAFGGNEMPGYHTGPAAHLGYLIGARHSHLDSAGYSLDQKLGSRGERPEPEEVLERLLEDERWRQVLTSLVVCLFARGIYDRELVARCLRASGLDIGPQGLEDLGTEIHREKYRFKLREGFSLEDLRLPGRIFETPTPLGNLTEDFFKRAIARFRQLTAIS